MSLNNLHSDSSKKKKESQLFLSCLPSQFIIKEISEKEKSQILLRKVRVKIIDPCNSSYIKNSLYFKHTYHSYIIGDFKGTIICSSENKSMQIPENFSQLFLENISSTFNLLSSHQNFKNWTPKIKKTKSFSALSIEYLIIGPEKSQKCIFYVLSDFIGGN